MSRSKIGLIAAVATGVVLASLTALPVQAATTATDGYLIATRAPLTASQLQQLTAAGATVTTVYSGIGGAAAALPSTAVNKVRALPFVTAVDLDTAATVDADTATAPLPGTGRPYWQDLADLDNTTRTGAGVWVAVLDTGFYPNWTDYLNPGKVLTSYARAFTGPKAADTSAWDAGSDPHGMAVAASVVGYRLKDGPDEGGFGAGYTTGAAGTYAVPGIAPDARILPVKVCQPLGCFASAISAGLDYVTKLRKANPRQPIVVNLSLGAASMPQVEKAALDAAIAAGIVVVASAGNDGTAGMTFPAAYEPVVSVGAGGWTGQWQHWPDKTWWLGDVPEQSSRDIYLSGFSARQKPGQYLDLVSSGSQLLLPYPCAQLYKNGTLTAATEHRTCASKAAPKSAHAAPYQYLFLSGTSFAAPVVSGIAALLLQAQPTVTNADATLGPLSNPASWTPGSLERRLEQTATPLAAGGTTVTGRDGQPMTQTWGSDATGAGWANAAAALAGW